MKKNNWRFEALARARIIRQEYCQRTECLYFNKKFFKNCSIPKDLMEIKDCIYYTEAKKENGGTGL